MSNNNYFATLALIWIAFGICIGVPWYLWAAELLLVALVWLWVRKETM